MSRMNWDKTRINSLKDRDRRSDAYEWPFIPSAPVVATPPIVKMERMLQGAIKKIAAANPGMLQSEVYDMAERWVRKNFNKKTAV